MVGGNLSLGKIWRSSRLKRNLGNILSCARHETALTHGPLRKRAPQNLLKAPRVHSELPQKTARKRKKTRKKGKRRRRKVSDRNFCADGSLGITRNVRTCTAWDRLAQLRGTKSDKNDGKQKPTAREFGTPYRPFVASKTCLRLLLENVSFFLSIYMYIYIYFFLLPSSFFLSSLFSLLSSLFSLLSSLFSLLSSLSSLFFLLSCFCWINGPYKMFNILSCLVLLWPLACGTAFLKCGGVVLKTG